MSDQDSMMGQRIFSKNLEAANRPLLRWAGSKRGQLQALVSLVPRSIDTYVEPFCGSAALFYRLQPRKAYLSDINVRLIGFYEACRTNPEAVYKAAACIPRERESYISTRSKFNDESDPILAAGYFYYLNQNCFNGLYRTNRSGKFNVPFSGRRMGQSLSSKQFRDLCAPLSAAHFSACDFETTIKANLAPGSFFFIDPPYAVSYRRPFTDYYKDAFTPDDLTRLMKALKEIDNAGGTFLLTYDASSTEFFKRRGWFRTELSVRRNISGFASHRKTTTEIVITNYRTAC